MDRTAAARAGIARIGIERDNSDLLMAAPSLCGNPAADASARANLIAVKPDSRTIRIRLDPSATPVGQDEERLYLSL